MTDHGLLIIDLEGSQLRPDERELLRDPLIGGVILFSRNIGSRAALLELTASLRDLRPDLLLTVDQEGGRVQRLRDGWTALPPMRVHGERWAQDEEQALTGARQHGWLMATEVLASGIDLSFAPVLDIDSGRSAVIGDRALSADPAVAAQLARAFIEGMHEAGMAATGKHFPGHGSVAADSHTSLPVDERPWQLIEECDLPVFEQCMPSLDAMMPAHVVYPAVDSAPAGFSRIWLQDVLRTRLGFEGVIFSDDLSMAGAGWAGDIEARTDAALNAGCDCLLICNDRPLVSRALTHLRSRAPAAARRPLSGLLAGAAMDRAAQQLGGQHWEQARDTLTRMIGT